MDQTPIIVTERDYERIDALLTGVVKELPGIQALRDELQRAEVVLPDEIPPDVVTMNSRVRFENIATGKQAELTLVYPQDVDGNPDKVSILAPVGSALLGLSVGQTIEWQMSGGSILKLKVLEVRDQPEAKHAG